MPFAGPALLCLAVLACAEVPAETSEVADTVDDIHASFPIEPPPHVVESDTDVPEVVEPEEPEVSEEPVEPDEPVEPVVDVVAEPTASAGVMSSPDEGQTWLVADADNHEVLVIDRLYGLQQQLPVDGGEPARIVSDGDQAFVTLTGSGEVAQLTRDATGWGVVQRVPAGAEPYGIAIAGDHVFVAASQSDAVLVFDAASLDLVERKPVPGQPRWLVSTGDGVIAVSASQPLVSWVHLGGDTVTEPLPVRQRYDVHGVSSQCVQRDLARRATGDPAILADGRIVVPAVHIDHALRQALVEPYWCASQIEAPMLYYAPPMPPASEHDVARWNPILQVFTLEHGNLQARQPVLIDTSRGSEMIRSVPTSAHAVELPEGDRVAVSMENADEMLIVDYSSNPRFEDSLFFSWPATPIHSLGLPQVGGTEDMVMTWSLHDRVLSRWSDVYNDVSVAYATTPSALPLDVHEGRRLFHTSIDPRVVSANSGGACSNCHVGGRTDGITWELEVGDRQTPSLAGFVDVTLPATWTLDVTSVAEEADLTSSGRMGGAGLPPEDLDSMAAYINWTRGVRRPQDQDPALLAEGEDLFNDPMVGCATCHAGARYTDNEHHTVLDFDEPTNTPSLSGVAATAPYLHDGSAATLRDVLMRTRDGSMGDTRLLTIHQMEALEAYLMSLE